MRRTSCTELVILGLNLLVTSPSARGQSLSANEKYVTLVYQDLLGRTPLPSELSTLAGQLDLGGLTRTGLGDLTTDSDEYVARQVNGYYQRYLGRPADGGALAVFLPAVQLGTTLEEVQGEVVGGLEYFMLAGSDNAAFLNKLYNDILGRPIDGAGSAALLPGLTAGTLTREQAAHFVLTSLEFRDGLVSDFLMDLLRRPASRAEVGPLVTFLAGGGTDQGVVIQIIASQEYFDLAQTIPEPAAAAMMLIGGAFVACAGMRRRLLA